MRPLLVTAALSLGLVLCACTDDPQDPKTWIKKLDNPRDQREAVRMLTKLKDESAYEGLAKLFERSRDPDHLKAIAALRTDKAVDLFIQQLDYSDDSYDNATTAATGLRDIAARDDRGRTAAAKAAEALNKAVLKKLPIKTRANIVKVEAMKAMAAIRDPRSVDALDQVLETSADEQDFYLNKEAARHLGTVADKRSIPSLVRGLFMTGRGGDIFRDCRLALVKIGGDEAADKLVETMQRKNKAVEEDAKAHQFERGIIVQKTSILLGDLRNPRALPALLAELDKKDDGVAADCTPRDCVSGHQSVLEAVGNIGGASARTKLQAIVLDPRRHIKHRTAAAAALNLLGDPAALPALLQLARSPYYDAKKKEIDQDKAMLAAYGVTEYSRLLDSDAADLLRGLYDAAPPDTDVQVAFKNALARGALVKKCAKDIACYADRLSKADADKTVVSALSEKAAFMLGRLGREAVPLLARHVGHKDPPTREAVLFSLTRVAQKGDQAVLKALQDQIEVDKSKPREFQPLVDKMRITELIIMHR